MRKRSCARKSGFITAIALACTCSVATASAEPLTITSGRVSVAWDGSGNPFRIVGETFDVSGGRPGVTARRGLTPGTVVDLSKTVDVGGPGHAQVGDSSIRVFTRGTFDFSVVPFTATVSSHPLVSFSAPFTMTGSLSAFAGPFFPQPDAQPLFTLDVAGRGTVVAGPYRNLETAYLLNSGGELYTFEGAAAPVPEPATLILFGVSSLGVAAARRKHKRRKA